MSTIAHMVREGGLLTEPFIAMRVAANVRGFQSEQWSEQGVAPEGVELIAVPSKLIGPGSLAARAFHHVPQLGAAQAGAYRVVANARRPDVIHAHYLTTGYLALAASSPLVVSAYGFDVSLMSRRPLWRRAFRYLSPRVRVVLVEGPHMRETTIALGFPEDRVRIVRIAVGHEAVPFLARTSPVGRGPRLLAAGRFVEKKGFDLAIRAFAAVRDRWPDATLELVGDGPLDAELRRTTAALRAADQITFSGRLARDAYLARMASADVFLAPSVTAANGDSEGGAPTTILDAQAVGTIVVGSTHADIPFLVQDGESGYLAPEGSLDGFVAALTRALDERERWPTIATAARGAIMRNHTDVSLAAGLADAYAMAMR